jgi:hypothetical protein
MVPRWWRLNIGKNGGEEMNSRICEYVSGHTEPDFFDRPDDALSDIQIEIQRGIKAATEVMTIEVDEELMRRAEEKLAEIGWTLEEASILYLYWCIECPDAAEAWTAKCESLEEQSCSTSPETPTGTSAESSGSVTL